MSYAGSSAPEPSTPKAGSGLIPKATVPLGTRKKRKHPLEFIQRTLKEQVIGQEEAVAAITRALTRAAAGFRNKEKPIATFFFSGPSGVGKTQAVKALAQSIHNDPKAILRVDCSEFSEAHSVARLIGSPPGYVGSDLPVILDKEEIEGREWSIVLFDEVEKAHPALHNMLLHIMDEGRLSLARKTHEGSSEVDFTSSIIIMTSNVGSRHVSSLLENKGIGFTGTLQTTTKDRVDAAVKREMEKAFSPEFRNRITDFVVFNPLDEKTVSSILDRILDQSLGRFANAGFAVKVPPKVKRFLLEEGYDAELGARPLILAVERFIDAEVADLFSAGEIRPGDYVVADVNRRRQITFKRAERVKLRGADGMELPEPIARAAGG
ncbi:MAG: ATP-dependent Clp protease ATP-binding subunit [Nitrospirae bacterium]|nr:ATP-dependent Clp protease ATP-binding subunit [Nitrospirota bacterium]